MWFVFTLISIFMQGLVNYIDEFLTNNNKLPESSDKQTKIGGLVLISTLMSFVGAALMTFIPHDPIISNQAKILALSSAIPMVGMYISYFWLLITYPVHQVTPIFLISSLWLLLLELAFGGTITTVGLLGIFTLVYGAYVLDAGTFKWKIPTKLLLIGIPATSTWAIALYMAKVATESNSPIAFSYYQMLGVGIVGVLLFILIKKFRDGFLFRIKKQGKVFLGLSLVNESLAEGSFLFGNMAVSIAPVAAYITALSGVQSIFVLLLFWFFPQGKRTKATSIQWFAIILIMFGVFLIEGY
jgi:drug/metabolite transporter (DMT)-like permease